MGHASDSQPDSRGYGLSCRGAQRGTSARCKPSPARLGWVAGSRRGCSCLPPPVLTHDAATGTGVACTWRHRTPHVRPAARGPPVCAWHCVVKTLTAQPRPLAPAARPPGGLHADEPRAQGQAPPGHGEPLPPVPGTRRRPDASALVPARGSGRHNPRRCRGMRLLRRLPTPAGAHATPVSEPGTTGQHVRQYACRLGPRLPPGLGRVGVAVMTQGHRGWGLGRSDLVGFCSGPRQATTLRPATQRRASGAADSRSGA